MKAKIIAAILMAIVLSGCNQSMPFQNMSTANYAYAPPSESYNYRSGSGICYGYYGGQNCTSSSVSGYRHPENAFESLKDSAWNWESISRSMKNIDRMWGGRGY